MTGVYNKIPQGQYTGKPCKKCGSLLRYHSTRCCASCDKAKHRKKIRPNYCESIADNEKTRRRRDAEERLLNKELGL
jgi:hypothetical protein